MLHGGNYVEQISQLLTFFMIVGVVASSISGAIRAIEARMDITGAILLAFVASNAGGTVRDLILGARVFWIREQYYIWLTVGVGALSFMIVYINHKVINSRTLYKILIFTDAMGLAAFCLAGVEKSLNMGQNYTIAIIMGVWTAIGGGIAADIITNRVPLVLSKEFYITVALVGSVCFLFLSQFMSHAYASGVAALIMITFRLYSVKYGWKLPII